MSQRALMAMRLRDIALQLNRLADGVDNKTLSHVDLTAGIDAAGIALKALPADRKYL